MQEKEVLRQLQLNEGKLTLYCAGLPSFPRNFARDSILSAILMQDKTMLRDQLIFCAQKQGTKKDPYTGEEPGKIFHEFPGVEIRNKSTLYNACDTTALFLIGHKIYQDLTNDQTFLSQQRNTILNAVTYIKNHLVNGLFTEDPAFCNAESYALKVTYWKDSEMPRRTNGDSNYPVTYFLAHTQAMHALRCAHILLNEETVHQTFLEMKKSLSNFFNLKTNSTYIAIDDEGPIAATSSDFLHSLMYLERTDLSQPIIDLIIEKSKELETNSGYFSLSEKESEHITDEYHAAIVWPFEQAIIHAGAKKFGLKKVEEVSLRAFRFLKTQPELLSEKGECKGNDPQLWTLAAKSYFTKQ